MLLCKGAKVGRQWVGSGPRHDLGCHRFFSCLWALMAKAPSMVQWGLVRTVVRSDGLPAKDRTSLAPLTPQAPESPQRSEFLGDVLDAPGMIPRVKPCQHVRQLKVRVCVGVFEAHLGYSKCPTYLASAISMPNSVDDETAGRCRAADVDHGMSHHVDFGGNVSGLNFV